MLFLSLLMIMDSMTLVIMDLKSGLHKWTSCHPMVFDLRIIMSSQYVPHQDVNLCLENKLT